MVILFRWPPQTRHLHFTHPVNYRGNQWQVTIILAMRCTQSTLEHPRYTNTFSLRSWLFQLKPIPKKYSTQQRKVRSLSEIYHSFGPQSAYITLIDAEISTQEHLCSQVADCMLSPHTLPNSEVNATFRPLTICYWNKTMRQVSKYGRTTFDSICREKIIQRGLIFMLLFPFYPDHLN